MEILAEFGRHGLGWADELRRAVALAPDALGAEDSFRDVTVDVGEQTTQERRLKLGA